MKKLTILVLLCSIGASLFAGPLIDAAKNQDYKTFEKLVKQGADLNEVNESGMNVQLSLAYFNDKDFKKACSLLARKGFNFDVPVENNISLLHALSYSCSHEKLAVLLKYKVDVNRKDSLSNLRPIDTTQFSTYKFYSEQDIPSTAKSRAEKTRKLLMKHGSEEFKYHEPTIGEFGNTFICIYAVVASFFPDFTPAMLLEYDILDETVTDGQQIATLNQAKVAKTLRSMGFDAEINNWYDTDTILKKLVETAKSQETYMLMACMGKNPVAPYQWVIINGGNYVENPSPDTSLITLNSDALYKFVDFQAKDISQLVTIKLYE